MKFIYDEDKYKSDKTTERKTYTYPKRAFDICGWLLLGYIVLIFTSALFMGFVKPSLAQIRVIVVIAIGVALLLITAMVVASFFIKPRSANSVYGEVLENGYKIIEHRVLYIGTAKDPCLRISYETSKGKRKMVLIPLKEKGFYYNIFEDVFDFAYSEGGSLNWYRPLSVELDRLKEEADERELPEHIKSLYLE